jgi:hypothetical protein
MSDLPDRLNSIKEAAIDFFHKVNCVALYGTNSRTLSPDELLRAHRIRQELGQVMREVSALFKCSPLLGEDALPTLQRAIRSMDSALRLRQWVHREGSVHYDEDRTMEVKSDEWENVAEPAWAGSIFREEIDKILGLVSLAGQDVANVLVARGQAEERRGYRTEVRQWMRDKGINTIPDAASRLAVGPDTLKSIMSSKGKRRFSDRTLQEVLKKITDSSPIDA